MLTCEPVDVINECHAMWNVSNCLMYVLYCQCIYYLPFEFEVDLCRYIFICVYVPYLSV